MGCKGVYITLTCLHDGWFVLGVLSSLRGVAVKEGFLGLYKGNWAQMIRIFPYAAVQFLAYEQYKKVCIHSGYYMSGHFI